MRLVSDFLRILDLILSISRPGWGWFKTFFFSSCQINVPGLDVPGHLVWQGSLLIVWHTPRALRFLWQMSWLVLISGKHRSKNTDLRSTNLQAPSIDWLPFCAHHFERLAVPHHEIVSKRSHFCRKMLASGYSWRFLVSGKSTIDTPKYPLVICYIAIENGHLVSWFTH